MAINEIFGPDTYKTRKARPMARIAERVLSFLFSSSDASPDVVIPASPQPAPDAEIEQRRKWLGPSADVTHPDFGSRTNKASENYAIRYDLVPQEVSIMDYGIPGNPRVVGQKTIHTVIETVQNHKGHIVATNQLGEIT